MDLQYIFFFKTTLNFRKLQFINYIFRMRVVDYVMSCVQLSNRILEMLRIREHCTSLYSLQGYILLLIVVNFIFCQYV